MAPRISTVRQDDTHRLIPVRWAEEGEGSVLGRLGPELNINNLFELDGATNPRLVAETQGLPGISRELVFGVPYAHIINGCFTHPHPNGSRFNDSTRGAWYAAFELATSEAEVAYHKAQELAEIDWTEEEISPYVDFLADFRTEFHDIRDDQEYLGCLDPDSYAQSQQLANTLLGAGSAGILYPSVRCPGRPCLACFRPLLVMNVRRGSRVTLTFRGPDIPYEVARE